MARKSRQVLMPMALPADLFKWVKAQADAKALDPESWVRMTLKELSEGRADSVSAPQLVFTPGWPQPSTPEPPPAAESDIDAIVGDKLAEGLPFDAGAHDQPATAEVRPLHRPPTPFSPQNQPRHLSGL